METSIALGFGATVALLIGIYQRLGDNQKKIERMFELFQERQERDRKS